MLWLWFGAALAGAVEIGVERPGVVRVRSTGAPVHVPACRGINWERFDTQKGRFVPVPGAPCGPLEPALRIDGEGRLFSLDVRLPPLPKTGFHVVRAVVVVGQKCVGETPFPVAKCTDLETLEGPQMIVRHRGLKGR
jgi:hypothetical protein